MATSKVILSNIENKDTSSLFEDLQVFCNTTDGQCQSFDILSILKALFHLMDELDQYKKDDVNLSLVPSVSLCVEYLKSDLVIEDSLKDQFLQILFRVIKIYFKFELHSSALLYATNLKQFILDENISVTNKNHFKSLNGLFWQEALNLEKKNEVSLCFQLRCQAVEFAIFEDNLPVAKDHAFKLLQYCYNNEHKNSSEIIKFLQSVWEKIHDRKGYDHMLYLFKLLYSWFAVSLKYCKDMSILRFILSLMEELSLYFMEYSNRLIWTLVKNEEGDEKQINLLEEHKNFVKKSLQKLESNGRSNEVKNIFLNCATYIGCIGQSLYNSGHYHESSYIIETLLDFMDVEEQIYQWKRHLAKAYYLSGNCKMSLQTVVKLLLSYKDKRNECLELWHKIKRDAFRKKDISVASSIISDVLVEINVEISEEEEMSFLLQELGGYKVRRYNFEEEILNLVKKLKSLQCNGINWANVMLEIITMGSPMTKKISSFLNKSSVNMCYESIDLFKEYLEENSSNNEVKLKLSINYVWLFFLKLQLLHKQAKMDAAVDDQRKSEDEESDSEMMPTIPLLTFLVEAETIKSLEMALELWSDIFKDPKTSPSELTELAKSWDLLTFMQATAEYFFLSAQDVNELRTLVLLQSIASTIENKQLAFSSSVSLINFLVRMGYLEMASQMLNKVTEIYLNNDCITDLEKLKLQVAESNLYLEKGKFDEGLILLRKIIESLSVEKSQKSVQILQIQSLMLQSKFILLPPSAFKVTQNIDYLNVHNAISSAKSFRDRATRLLKENEKQRNECSNDSIVHRAELLKSNLAAYLQLGEHYIRIGYPRAANFYLSEGLKIAEEHILTYWSSRFLILLGKVDLLYQDLNSCTVKLNTLQYIMDQNFKENATMLLSKAFSDTIVSESRNSSESFIISSETQVHFKRCIKQNFINNSDVHSSPISKTRETNSKFEVKSDILFDNMFSFCLIKLEIWALSCLHLIAENKTLLAESQLKKLLKKCELLKHSTKKICHVIKTFNKDLCDLTKNVLNRNPSISETMLSVAALLKLSLLHFDKGDFKSTENYFDSAFKALRESSEHEKYLHSNMYSLLKYHKTVVSLKNLIGIKPESCLEVNICPSVKVNIIPTKNILKNSSYVNVETPKKANVPKILITRSKKNICKAPLKKDVLPAHIKKDMQVLSNLNRLPSVVFSSSDDDFMSPVLTQTKDKKTVSSSAENQDEDKTTYKFFKSKNSDLSIKSSSDIWKSLDFDTPKVKKTGKSKPCQIAPMSLRKTRQNTRALKSDSICSSLLNVSSVKQIRKLRSNPKSLKRSNIDSTIENISPPDDYEANRVSMGRYRDTSKSHKDPNVFKGVAEEDVFYPDCAGDVLNVERHSITSDLAVKSPCIETLCDDLDGLNLIENTNYLKELTIPDKELEEFIDELDQTRLLIQHNAPYPLYVNLCKLLAVLKMCKNRNSSKQHDFAFLLSETFSSILRELCLSNHFKEKSNMEDESPKLSRLLKRKDTCIINQMECLLSAIPEDYTVVQITPLFEQELKATSVSNEAVSKLIICRYQQNQEPLVTCLNACTSESLTSNIFDKFDKILNENSTVTKNTDKTDKNTWWRTRSTFNDDLKSLVQDMENTWLGCWKGLLLSSACNEERIKLLQEIRDSICKLSEPSNKTLLEVLLDSASVLSREQLSAAVCYLWNCKPSDESYCHIFNSLHEATVKLPETKRNPLVLILDKDIQALPWENLPILSNVPVSRMPSLSIMISKLAMPDIKSVLQKGLNCSNTFYVVNPENDIKEDQEYFQPRFEKQTNWKGIVGKNPNRGECASALEKCDLFVFIGHGSGTKCLEGTKIDKLLCHASVILMGCSSGRLKQDRDQLEGDRKQIRGGRTHFEGYGIPLTYLMNECPCVVGNLWDVTNRDINKFTDKLLELLVPNYKEDQATTDVATAVAQARSSCKMKYLVGSAPVVYGFPVFAMK